MPIDSATQVNASVVLPKEVYEVLKEIAKREKRSVSKQISYWIEQKIEEEKIKTDVRGRYNPENQDR